MGNIARDARRRRGAAITLHRDYLGFYDGSPRSSRVHMVPARVSRDWGGRFEGNAAAHLNRAAALDPGNEEVKKEMGKKPLRPLALADMEDLLTKFKYAPRVPAGVVRVTRLSFRLDPENAGHIALLKKMKIPAVAAAAILDSNRRLGSVPAGDHAAKKGGVGKGREDNPPGREPTKLSPGPRGPTGSKGSIRLQEAGLPSSAGGGPGRPSPTGLPGNRRR